MKSKNTKALKHIQKPAISVNALDRNSMFSIGWFKDKFNNKFHKAKMHEVLMLLDNGKFILFYVKTSKASFTRKGKEYVFDYDLAIEDAVSGTKTTFFHESSSIPFKMNFNLDALRESVKKEHPDVDKSLNPRNLRSFINSEVIEKVMRGTELSDEMRFIKMIVVINACLTIIIGFMIGKTNGWF